MSMKVKTAVIVVGLLAAVGLFNYAIKMDPNQLAERGVGHDAHSHGDEHADEEGKPGPEDLMQPIGPEDAPVLIQVLVGDTNELEMPLRPMMTRVAAGYPNLVRVEFIDPKSEEYKQLREKTGGAVTGLLINGEMVKEIPEAKLGFVTFQGSPTFEEWSEEDVHLAVEHELEQKGIEFTPQVEHDHPGAGAQMGHEHSHEGHDH